MQDDALIDSAGKVVRGTAYFTVARIFTFVFTALTSILLARFLGESGYGLWTLAVSTFGIFTLLADLPGTDSAIIRYVSKYEAENKHGALRSLVTTSLKLRLLFTGLCCASTLILAGYVANKIMNYPELAILLTIFAVGHFFTSLDLRSVSVALKKFHYTAFLNVLDSVLGFFFIVLFLLFGYGIVGVALGRLLIMSIVPLLTFFLIYTRFLPSSGSCSGENETAFASTSKRIVAYGVPLSIAGLMGGFTNNFMKFMLGLYVDLEVLGYFAVAWNMMDMMKSSASLVTQPLFPIISELETRGHKETINELLSTLFKYMVFVGATVVIFVELFAPQIVCLIFSESFEPAAIFLRMLIILFLADIFFHLTETLFMGMGRSDISLKIRIICMTFSFPAMILLIPSFGVLGVIVMTIILNFSLGLFIESYYLIRTIGKIPFKFKPLVKMLPALGIMAVIFLMIRPFIIYNTFYLITSALLALPMSFILACFTGGVKKDEIDILENSLPPSLLQSFQSIFSCLKRISRE